jgi:hypothetical protein
MEPSSRRDVLVATAAGGPTVAVTAGAASYGNPDEPPQGVVTTEGNPASATVIGPNNPALSNQFPGAFRHRQPTSATCLCSGPRSTMRLLGKVGSSREHGRNSWKILSEALMP